MRSFAYLIIRSVKNNLLEIFRKPAKLALYLIVIAAIIGIFVMSFSNQRQTENVLDLVWLKGILFALILLFFIIAIQKGLQSGDLIFDMNDVNFLFVSPIRPQSVLLYGVVRMMKMSFLAGFFILFQGGSLHTGFNVHFDGTLLIFIGFILAVSHLQILSLLIYSLTNGRPKRKWFVRIVSISAFLPMLVHGMGRFIETNGNVMNTLESLLRSPVTAWTPVVGWASEGTMAFITGNPSRGFLFFGLLAVTGGLLITYIARSNPDYYEDVLVASETAFEKKRSLMEGQINTEATSNRKVRVKATGIQGIGASSLFYKHLRESFRANRFGLWGISSLLIVAGSALFAILIGKVGTNDNANHSGSNLIVLLQTFMWAQIFLIGTGRGLKELYSHYIYMIPDPPLNKIVWSNLELVFKVLVESLLAFGIAGVILRESPLTIIAAIVVYTLFSLLLLGVNYVFLRWTDVDMSGGLLVMLYMFAVVIVMLPGLVPALIIGSVINGWGLLIGLGILAVWEFLASFVCFALSIGILHRCDMPVMKTTK